MCASYAVLRRNIVADFHREGDVNGPDAFSFCSISRENGKISINGCAFDPNRDLPVRGNNGLRIVLNAGKAAEIATQILRLV